MGTERRNNMREQNILIFSSGDAYEHDNYPQRIKKRLYDEPYRCQCTTWKDEDFFASKDNKNIALLPSLLKRIPTYDFVILVIEKNENDSVSINNKRRYIPRDNVIFELGLSAMAVGQDRVIIMSEDGVHLPYDIMGTDGKEGFKVVRFLKESFDKKIDELGQYILDNYHKISPVVIGAANSTAVGYFENFIKKVYGNLDEGRGIVYQDENGNTKPHKLKKNEIVFDIYLPENLSHDTNGKIAGYYETLSCINAHIEEENEENKSHKEPRSSIFRICFKNGRLHIVDIPTTFKATYEMVKRINDLEADSSDNDAAVAIKEKYLRQFLNKEVEVFEYTLHNLCDQYINEMKPEDLHINIIKANI